jgi:hypothetical protein
MRLRKPWLQSFVVHRPSRPSRVQFQRRQQISNSPHSHNTTQTDNHRPSFDFRLSQQLVPQALHLSLRKALVNMAQDMLDLSEYLFNAHTVIQTLCDHKSTLRQLYIQTSNENTELKNELEMKIESIDQSLMRVKNETLQARQRDFPATESRFYLRLKRIHARLPYSQIQYITPGKDEDWQNRQNKITLKALLSLPMPNLLEELALHLISTSLPFDQGAFLTIIHQLSRLRYASAARSAYYHLIAAGYPPDSRKAISVLLMLTQSIGDEGEFARLRRLVLTSQMVHDAHTYGALIVGSLKLGHTTNAKRYLRAMLCAGISPTLEVLTTLLHDCGNRKNWKLGMDIWRTLKDKGISMDALCYHEMWRLCKRCGQVSMARDVYSEAVQDGFEPRDFTRRPPVKQHPIRPPNKAPVLYDYEQSVYSLFLSANSRRDRLTLSTTVNYTGSQSERQSFDRLNRRGFEAEGRVPDSVSGLFKKGGPLQHQHFVVRPGQESWTRFLTEFSAVSMRFSAVAKAQERLRNLESQRRKKFPQHLFSLRRIIDSPPPEPVVIKLRGHPTHSPLAGTIDDEHIFDIIQEASSDFFATINLSSRPWRHSRAKRRRIDPVRLTEAALSKRLRLRQISSRSARIGPTSPLLTGSVRRQPKQTTS